MVIGENSNQLLLTTEGEIVICFDKSTHRHEVLYRHPSQDYMFGIVCMETLSIKKNVLAG
jgi:hypothetical protein